MDQINETRSMIQKAFFIDQLQLRDGPQMTATEVMQRSDESLRLLSPSIGRHEGEFLKPTAEDLFDIMHRKGLFPKAPEILKGKRINFKFSSAIAKAQLATEVLKIQKALNAISGIAGAQPQTIDYIDGDVLTKYVFNALGVPQQIIRDEKDVKQLRDARAEAQQQQMQMIQEKHSAEVANKAAPIMGE